MALSYLYGKKFVAVPTPLILQLRKELYPHPYSQIVWSQAQNLCAKVNFFLLLHVLVDKKKHLITLIIDTKLFSKKKHLITLII